MTYQEFIETYSWVELAWEIFKGVSPTVIAILTIFVTQHCIKKRELQYKKKEMRLQYLEKILNWIHQIKNDIFEVSRMLEKALEKRDPVERNRECNNFIKEFSKMNSSIAIWSDTYDSVIDVFGYDINLKNFKRSCHAFGDEMMNILNKYISELDTDNAVEEINAQITQVMNDLNKSVAMLVREIELLYEK